MNDNNNNFEEEAEDTSKTRVKTALASNGSANGSSADKLNMRIFNEVANNFTQVREESCWSLASRPTGIKSKLYLRS